METWATSGKFTSVRPIGEGHTQMGYAHRESMAKMTYWVRIYVDKNLTRLDPAVRDNYPTPGEVTARLPRIHASASEGTYYLLGAYGQAWPIDGKEAGPAGPCLLPEHLVGGAANG